MTSWTALRDGFDAFTRRLPLLLGAWLVILACQQVIRLLVPDSMIWLQIMVMVILAPLHAGQYLLAVKVVRREPVVFKELFEGMPQAGPIIGAYLLFNLLTLLGFVALIIPGILVGLTYAFVLIRFLDPKEGMRTIGPIEALRESASITRGYRGTLFGIGFLLAIPYMVLFFLLWMSTYDSSIPAWVIELVTILSGTLFLGPVAATSYMVVYDHAINHPRG